MDDFITPEDVRRWLERPTMTVMLELGERQANGLRDILDWLDIAQPADFSLDQLDGLEVLLEALGRNQIERYFHGPRPA